MLTLTAVIVWLALGWLLPGLTLSLLPGTTLPDDLVGTLLGLAAAVIALCSWQDLAPTRERWRTPFASAVAYIGGFSLYAAMLPTQLALVAGLTLAGPVAFLAEFVTGLAAPLALLAMPGMKAMLDPALRPARRPAWDAPRQAMLRFVVALVVGFICMAAMVGPMVQSIPAAAASMTTIWGEMLAALTGLVFFLSLIVALTLAWEQLAYD